MVFKDFTIAIGNFKNYRSLSTRTWKSVILYVAFLVLICSIGIVIIPTVRGGSRIIDGLMQTLPEFTITQEGLTISETFDFEIEGVRVLATNEKQVSEEDFGDVIFGILLDNDNLYIRKSGRTLDFTYGEFNLNGRGYSFSKKDILSLKPYWLIATLISDIMMWGWLLSSYLISGLIIGAVGIMMTVFLNIHINTSTIIKLALYSKTLPYLITAVLAAFGITMYSIIASALSAVILFLALREMREDNNIEQ